MATANNQNTLPNTYEPNAPLTVVNIQNSVKLSSTNYLSWKTQIESILIGYDLQKFIDGSHPPPPITITVDSSVTSNPAYITWLRQDKLLFGALVGTISSNLVPLVTHAKTSLEAWEILSNTYAKPTRGHIKQVRDNLKNITKGSHSITEYMQAIKVKSDELASLGKPVDPEDLIEIVLAGLDDSYQSVIDAINGRDCVISFCELHEKLINKELSIQQSLPASHFPSSAYFSQAPQSSQKHNNTKGRWSSRFPAPAQQNQNTPRQQRPFLGKCQWCRIQGHVVAHCPVFRQQFPTAVPPRFYSNSVTNNSVSTSPVSSTSASLPPWQHQAHTAGLSSNNQWLLDSGATHHITNDLQNLDLHQPYTGSDNIMVGDGTAVPITHTGSSTLLTPSHSFSLTNVLCAPLMKRNLISISQFCISNNASIEFLPTSFCVKDLKSGQILFQGQPRNGVYEWPQFTPPSSAAILAFSTVKTTSNIWHHRLGHPSSSTFNRIRTASHLDVSSSVVSHCNSCHCNKAHKLPFSVSTLSSSAPLQVLFTDVWCSPVISIDQYKYYLLIVDHFTKYMWIYPLKKKSDTASIFSSFIPLVENYFSGKIKTLYSDNGGEFQALSSLLVTHGITHLTTPPHTPEHNGTAERRHRHIVEIGLSLLSHASMPLSYWSFAFTTAVYLINRLPTPLLHFDSPYSRLFGLSPNYSKLKSFGCLCYPWLRPYNSHKLAAKSAPCLFVGYSPTQSAYLCYNTSTHKLIVSRHVRFVENLFPFSHSSSSHSSPPSESEWCSLILSFLPSTPASVAPPSPPTVPPFPSPAPTITPALPSTAPSPVSSSSSSSSPFPPPPCGIITRSKNHIYKPIQKLNLHSTISAPTAPPVAEPSTVHQALQSPPWRQAMVDEFNALLSNGTWDLVPSSPSQNLVGCKWIFRTKFLPNGCVDRYKARLVAKGFHQRPGVDYFETFSPVIKPTTVRVILSLAVSHGWPLRQLDINNAFLQGTLSEAVFMQQPPGFIDKDFPNHVCYLHKAIYGLKQAPRAWFSELRQFLLQSGFLNSIADASLFILQQFGSIIYLLVYVDDIIITGNNNIMLQQFITSLSTRFSLKDLGNLQYFLGVEVLSSAHGLFLCQRKYILDLLRRTHMADAKPVATPMATSPPLTPADGPSLSDPLEFRATIGSLQYLSLTRPDISFTVNKLSQFLQNPTTVHWSAVKRLLRYLRGTLDLGINFLRDSPLSLHAFSDADWAGNRPDYTSTGAYLVFLGRNPISWSSKKQRTVARSSTEAEYRAVASTAAEIRWLCSLLTELGVFLPVQPVIYCDNVGATSLCANPVFHSRMKHVALDFHFIREQVQHGLLRVSSVSAADQLVDVLTKPLPRSPFRHVLSKLGLSLSPSSLRGHIGPSILSADDSPATSSNHADSTADSAHMDSK